MGDIAGSLAIFTKKSNPNSRLPKVGENGQYSSINYVPVGGIAS